MQYNWLNKNGNKKLIIFFCGWSFDENPFKTLDCGEYDVLILYDYKNNELPLKILEYEEYYLIAWSMGVYIAYLLRDLLPAFVKKIAINGTPFPIDNECGIPQRTFDLTLKYVDTGLQGKFQRNLFKEETDYQKYLINPVLRQIPDQAAELKELKDFIINHTVSYQKFYDHAIISSADKIVPTKNQVNCWSKIAGIIMLDSGHFPFYSFESWDDILKCRQTQN
ncbi:TPA: DUF452 family protein [Candidatus Scatousia excrementigallinarum]|uniref:DUF452 family protein n=1 Tax=Candidatus Scatousia excrementigallinarum TaxID=2840935 RepID=A0A9D1EZX5_9BACT|nr:DUF452 family protein [Candidatus Scatousia excrementigallinarum]